MSRRFWMLGLKRMARMKNPTPEQRAEMVRILREIKADVSELRTLLERLRARRAG
jgi:hypothetical protein